MPTYVVLLGGPGAGKGTQAQLLCQQYGLPHIASGDLFREHLNRDTDLGKLARQYMDRGELVPDHVTIAMVRERLQRADAAPGALLDGFPRTVGQADALDTLLPDLGGRLDVVLYIEVDNQVLLERLSGRWICRGPNQHVYHLEFRPPKQPGICDVDGAPLYQRSDDTAEVQARRIQVFFEQTSPLIEHYRRQGRLVVVDGGLPIADVTAALRSQIEAAAHGKLLAQ